VHEDLPYLAKLVVERKASVPGTENVLSAIAALLPGSDVKLLDQICFAIFLGCSDENLRAADCHALRGLAIYFAQRFQKSMEKNPCTPRTDFSFPQANYTREADVQKFLVGQEKEYVKTFKSAHDVCGLLDGDINYNLLLDNKVMLMWEATRSEDGHKRFHFTKLFRSTEDDERRKHELSRERVDRLFRLFPSIRPATKAQQTSATQSRKVRGGAKKPAVVLKTSKSHAKKLGSKAQIASASSS
jgi:hypothetical protein